MRHHLTPLTTLALAGLLLLAPVAAAGAARLGADAATDEARAALGAAGDHADPAATPPESLWARVRLTFDAFSARLAAVFGLAGQDAPDLAGDVSLGVDATAGPDVEARVLGVDVDDASLADAEALAGDALARARDARSQVPLPAAPAIPAVPGVPTVG